VEEPIPCTTHEDCDSGICESSGFCFTGKLKGEGGLGNIFIAWMFLIYIKFIRCWRKSCPRIRWLDSGNRSTHHRHLLLQVWIISESILIDLCRLGTK
jgi:hypothetical protein